MKQQKKIENNNSILLLTTNNLTTNPRLQKEFVFLKTINKNISFVGFKLGNWSDENDKLFCDNTKANYKYIDISHKKSIDVITTTLIERISKFLNKFFSNNTHLSALSHNKRTFLMLQKVKRIKQPIEIIFAHNLGSLSPAYYLSKKTKTPFVFDVEDYHPGESCSTTEQKRRELLMQKILPYAHYITYASPLIGEYTHKLIPNFPKEKMILINNCFSKNEFSFVDNQTEKVQFVWFSQNIAQGRGLEYIVPILKQFENKVQLNLIGNLYTEFYNNFLHQYMSFVKIIAPLPQKELNLKICNYDIGLALEPGKDTNNNIALSNKIWAYLQAGLFIVATNTPAQKLFAQQHKQCTEIIDNTTNTTLQKIESIIKNINTIRQQKQNRFLYAQQFCWENESKKYDVIFNNLFHKNNNQT